MFPEAVAAGTWSGSGSEVQEESRPASDRVRVYPEHAVDIPFTPNAYTNPKAQQKS